MLSTSDLLAELRFLKSYSEANQTCQRKAVGCSAVLNATGSRVMAAHNGPVFSGAACSNEVGNCGCMHAEPRLVLGLAQEFEAIGQFSLVCTYSPCTQCANIIIESGFFSAVYYDILTEHDVRGRDRIAEAGIFTHEL